MPFPINPSVGDTYVENDTTYEYLGPVNGWYRKSVGPNNDTTYIGSGGAPGGVSNDTEVIFNDNGSLASDSGLTYDKATGDLTVSGTLTAGSLSGPSSFSLGSAASPSVYFGADTNTGLYSPGEDQVAISTNGSEKLRITSDGKLGVGTSAPSQLLDVRSSIGATQGLVGIGDVSLARLLVGYTPSGSPSSNDSAAVTVDNFGSITLSTRSAVANNIYFNTCTGTGAAAERARIDSSGRLLVGTATAVTGSAADIQSTTTINLAGVAVYADNAAAKTGGLVDGDVYRTSTGDLKIVYT